MNTQEVKSNILNTIQTNTTGNITGNILQQVLMNMMTVTDITFGSTDNVQYLKLDNIENSQVKLLTIGNAATDIELKYDSGVKFYAANTLMMEVADDGIYVNNYMDTKDINVDGDITLVHDKAIRDNTNQATNYIKFTGVAANPICEIKTNTLDIISNTINMADISIIYNTSTHITTIGKEGLNIVFDGASQEVVLELQSLYDIILNAGHDAELIANNKIKLETTNNDVDINANNINLNSTTIVNIDKVKLGTVKNSNNVNISNKFILAGFKLIGYIQSVRGIDGTEDISFINGTINNLYELIQDLVYHNIKNGIIDFVISDGGTDINVNLSFMYNGDSEEYIFYTQFIWNGSLIGYISSGSGNTIKLIPLT